LPALVLEDILMLLVISYLLVNVTIAISQ